LTAAGIDRERIALDQGIGYSKVADGYQDYAMMRNIDQFNYLGRPMMVAISRKGFGAKLFGLKKDDRLPVTLIAEAYMYLHGGRILRVHDVEETVQLTKMLDTINAGYWQR
jgi:Dihydropteroate synthase and related enzymes